MTVEEIRKQLIEMISQADDQEVGRILKRAAFDIDIYRSQKIISEIYPTRSQISGSFLKPALDAAKLAMLAELRNKGPITLGKLQSQFPNVNTLPIEDQTPEEEPAPKSWRDEPPLL